MKYLRGVLVVCTFLITALAATVLWYYWILWGVPRYALLLEAPLLFAVVIGILSLAVIIWKKNWWWGLAGFILVAGISGYWFAYAVSQEIGPVMTAEFSQEERSTYTNEDRILKIIFANRAGDNRFTIVYPETTSTDYFFRDEADIDYLKEYFSEAGFECSSLIDNLIETNRTSHLLTFKSDKAQGFVIDYSREFLVYTETYPTGWNDLRTDYPEAGCFTYISVPAYDPDTGLVVAVLGCQCDFLLGYGDLVLYKFDGSKLIQLHYYPLWIS